MKKHLTSVTVAFTCIFLPVSVYAGNISVTIPSYYDSEQIPSSKNKKDNGDGTITYELDEKKQEEWKKALIESFNESINKMLDDENYPCVIDFKYNDDMTEFSLLYKGEPSMQEAFAYELFPYVTAQIYQQVCGVKLEDVDYKLIYTDEETGEESASTYDDADKIMKSMIANSDNTDTKKSDSGSADQNVDKIFLDSDNSSLEYTGVETMPYDDSETLVVLKFNFTNKTASPESSGSFYNAKAYQNGIELTSYMGIGNDACGNTYKTILQGTTLEIGYAFMLQDMENPITVYMYDGFMSNSPCQIQEIALQ